jgi:broad specificity phosphatase PhoE
MIDFQSLGGSASFYFTRHGESEGNRDGIMQGRTPSTLTDKGRAQARQAGLWFRSRGIKTIVSSPLARAGQTARIIADETGVSDLRFLDELVEIDTGIFSNLTQAEARAKYPEAWLSFTRESWEGVPGSEKIEEILERTRAAWDRLFDIYREGKETLLCVTHSGFLQWMIRSTLGLTTWMPLLSTGGNCAISLLRVESGPSNEERPFPFVSWEMINVPPDLSSVDASPADH